ncbi:hypothetical protein FNV43_RR06128 [Rhamnella rubrinervis]|uniref:Protein argonaute 2-like n=1 Tax=Rhamnella rubrinervis TaxID=2594499 RepID=A0A8K0ML42_9ROSA|nr:hypothetical protein FNV43_RR06128 [Rhamnella rubrinervis]
MERGNAYRGRGGGRGAGGRGYRRVRGRGRGSGSGVGHQQHEQNQYHQRCDQHQNQQTSGSWSQSNAAGAAAVGEGVHRQYQQNQPHPQRYQVDVDLSRLEIASGSGEGSSARGGHARSQRGGGPWKGGPHQEWRPVTVPVESPGMSEKVLPVKHHDSDKIVPMKQPDDGGSNFIRTASLLVNYFPMKYNPESVIMHYDVDVKPEMPPKSDLPVKISKSDLSTIRNELFSDSSAQFPLSMTAYDGEKNIFSAVALPTGPFKVEVLRGQDTNARSYIITLKLVNELRLRKLTDYLRGCIPSVPRDILQGMDLVMNENPTRNMMSVWRNGRYFCPRNHKPNDDLGGGIGTFRGFQHSLKPTHQGLALCLDYSVFAFCNPMPVIDFLKKHIGVDGFDLKNFRRYRINAECALKGLKVYVTHHETKQKYTINGFTNEIAGDCTFDVEDPNGQNPPERIRLYNYYRDRYGKDIEYKDLPCLDLEKPGKRNYVPMEFCVLAGGQRFQKETLDRDAAIMLKNISLELPNVREKMICNMVRSEDGPCGGDVTRNFGFEVSMNMTKVRGRIIGPPELKLGAPNGKFTKIAVDKENCEWNLVDKLVVEGKPIQRWAVLDFSNFDRSKLFPEQFIPKFISRCRRLGIKMEEPLFYQPTSMNKFRSVDVLRELLEGVNERVYKIGKGHLQVLLCVMSRKDPGYKYLKWISETQIGIVTQCCLSSYANKANDQYLANLGLKINAKLGGSNVELSERLPLLEGAGHTMFLGADVNHPGSWTTTSPSIAAVVGSMNWPAGNRYAARVRPQDRRSEKILHFGDMCLELVETYARLNKVLPDKIILFRVGVSEGQFDMVLNEELLDLKRVFKTRSYSLSITLIVAQKCHQTRFFPASSQDGSSTGNVCPGTVVDTNIVHPFLNDFYLCSHNVSIGTSKPTHYYVLWDDHKFPSDHLQKLIYSMCFTMAHCTRPVSLVPPLYYADLAAHRGRLYHEAVVDGQPEASTVSSSPPASLASSPLSSAASTHERFFKLNAHLENNMFFI